MIRNPYEQSRKQATVASTGAPLTSGDSSVPRAAGRTWNNRVVASEEPIVNSNGEFNATNKRDLMQSSLILGQQIQRGNLHVTTAKNNNAVLKNALADKNGEAWTALGEVIGDQIWETLGRDGFARQTLITKDLAKGDVGRIPMRKKDVVAYYVSSNNPVTVASTVRQNYIFPPEVYITANILIEDKEIAQAPGDLLEDKYQDGLEQTLVAEDRMWLALARQAAPAYNDEILFNTFTPVIFTQMRTLIAQWGIPVTTAIISFDIWNDIIADNEFSTWFDPATKHEIVLEGSLGAIQGVNIITDGYRYDTLKVLSPGEVYFCGAPQTLGAITQRTPLSANPVNRYNLGEPRRGWFMQQIEGMTIANPRAIMRASRV